MRTKKYKILETEIVNGKSIDGNLKNLLKKRISAKILSVFNNTINIITSRKDIITLTTADISGPFIINLETPEKLLPFRKYFNVKAKIKFGKDIISISREYQLTIDIKNTRIWKSKFKNIKANPKNLKRCFHLIENRVNNFLAQIKPDQYTLYETLLERLENLRATIPEKNKYTFKVAALKLIGLGSGLTPSADDAFTGIIALFLLINKIKPDEEVDFFLKNFIEIIPLFKKKTTETSFQYLRLAGEGLFTGPVENLILSLNSGKTEEIKSSIARLASLGETSGLDTLIGIHFALKNLIERGVIK